MRTVQVIRYTFGACSSEPISDKTREFYAWIASVLSREECQVVPISDLQTVASIATIDGANVMQAIQKQIEEHIGDNWDEACSYAIFDIARATADYTIRSEWEMGIAHAVARFVGASLLEGKEPLCIVLLRSCPPEKDVVWGGLTPYLESKNAVIVDDLGRVRGHSNLAALIDRDEYRTQLLRARATAIDIVDLKMIKRLGHFWVDEGDCSYCARHYFDGSECKEEIGELVVGYVEDQYPEGNRPRIVYMDDESGWLRDVVIALEGKGFDSPIEADDLLNNAVSCLDQSGVPPLLVVPVVDTGNTLGSVLTQWKASGLQRPKILAVISTRKSTERHGCWSIESDGDKHEINYLLHKNRQRYVDDCPMCRLEIPQQTTGLQDHYQMLTSYDFWEMAGTLDCNQEESAETPPHRAAALRGVPPIRQIVHDNGPWLAKKAICLLESKLENCTLKGIPIVHLQEGGARSLPLYLRALVGATLIELPNWVRDQLSGGAAGLETVVEELRVKHPACARQLESVNPGHRVLLFEEFSVTGGTRADLTKLLHHLGRHVLAHLCVVSFEPRRLRAHNSFCLYDFQLPPEWLAAGHS